MGGENDTGGGKTTRPPARTAPPPTQLAAPASAFVKASPPGGNGLAARAASGSTSSVQATSLSKGTSGAITYVDLGTPGAVRAPSSSAPPPPLKFREPVELKGKAGFSPPQDLADEIKARIGNQVWVAVKFGSFAVGEIPIVWNGLWFETPPPSPDDGGHPIQIHHESFPVAQGAHPVLAINIDRGFVNGFLGWRTGSALTRDPAKFFRLHPLHELFGWTGLETLAPEDGQLQSELSHGKLFFDVKDIAFKVGVFPGSGQLTLRDENLDVDLSVDLDVKGLNQARLPLLRESTNRLFGGKSFAFDHSMGSAVGGLSGRITASFAAGVIDVRGTLHYQRARPNVSGSVTVLVTDLARARQVVRDQLGPDAPSDIAAASPDERLVITGWGHVDFALSEWLTGNADVVVHPEGYVTARGEIVPTTVIPLFRKREKDVDFFKAEASLPTPALIPGVGHISASGEVTLSAHGSFGPGTLHDLRISGLFSTHPSIPTRFELAGTISAPATAALGLRAWAGLKAKLFHRMEVASAGMTVEGKLELKMFAEAAARVGRRGSSSDSSKSEYYLQGHLEAGAALELDLKMWFSGSALIWKGNIKALDRSYRLGSTAIRLDYVYALDKGGESSVKADFSKVAFDEDKFLDDVIQNETLEHKQFAGDISPDTEKTKSDIDNPDAPTPIALPDPGAPLPTASGPSKTLTADFTMDRKDHVLHLTLSDPPGLAMQSVFEPLLRKVARARTLVQKDKSISETDRASRLTKLQAIEDSAKAVQDAAKTASKAPRYVTPQVPGFKELAALIHDYGSEYGVSDLGQALDQVVVDPAKPESVLRKFPGLAGDVFIKARVARIIASGVDAVALRKILDNIAATKEEQAANLLEMIETMIASGSPNWEDVIRDMAIGRNKFKGAEFVVRYIHTTLGWGDVSFEIGDDPLDASGRRWDAWVAGTLYQFKSWYSWTGYAEKTFLRQMLEDYRKTFTGTLMELLWVFETSLSLEDLIANMTEALNRVIKDLDEGKEPVVPGYTPAIARFILSRLNAIVRKA